MRELTELGRFAADAIQGDTVSFISWYRDGRLLTANSEFEAFTGHPGQELSRMKWPDDFASQETCRNITDAMDRLDQGKESREYDEELTRKDGSTVSAMLFVHKYYPENGEPFYFSFITDITERKKEQLALQEAKAQAELFLDIMGHDINNLNQIASGYLEMALNTISLKPGERELILTSLGSLMNASRIIDNVKRIQQERAGLYKLKIIDLDGVIRNVIRQFSETPGREITISYTPCTCRVKGNELLNDVFINLVGNAIKHSRGPLTINILTDNIQKDNTGYCRISVEDNGPGIPDHAKGKYLDDACLVKTRATGRGFGLCLTKTIVEDLGGKLTVEDRVAGDYTMGARFIVLLPAVSGSEAAVQEAHA